MYIQFAIVIFSFKKRIYIVEIVIEGDFSEKSISKELSWLVLESLSLISGFLSAVEEGSGMHAILSSRTAAFCQPHCNSQSLDRQLPHVEYSSPEYYVSLCGPP